MSADRTTPPVGDAMQRTIDQIYRRESRRILATLIRVLGDFDRAEEAMHDAFRAALEQWPASGVPGSPRAWLVSTGRFKAIDRLRRDARFDALDDVAAARMGTPAAMESWDDEPLVDDRLRLIFTCCHPALAPDAQIALTLREVCGLTTEEIARAYLTSAPTLAQRIVRAKTKIREASIPYQVPEAAQLPERLENVLRVIYLVFNEGYSASFGEQVTRASLSQEAIRLGRLLLELLPDSDVHGLLALMRRALRVPVVSSYSVQAAIAAEHAQASSVHETSWERIVGWYDVLLAADPSPVIALNRAVAIAMRDGPEHGLEIIESLLSDGALAAYHLAHAARGELNARLGRTEEARTCFEAALARAQQEPERRHLQRRLAELSAVQPPRDASTHQVSASRRLALAASKCVRCASCNRSRWAAIDA